MQIWKPVFWLALVVVTTQAFAADEIHWTITGQNSVTLDWRGAVTEKFIKMGIPFTPLVLIHHGQ